MIFDYLVNCVFSSVPQQRIPHRLPDFDMLFNIVVAAGTVPEPEASTLNLWQFCIRQCICWLIIKHLQNSSDNKVVKDV